MANNSVEINTSFENCYIVFDVLIFNMSCM